MQETKKRTLNDADAAAATKRGCSREDKKSVKCDSSDNSDTGSDDSDSDSDSGSDSDSDSDSGSDSGSDTGSGSEESDSDSDSDADSGSEESGSGSEGSEGSEGSDEKSVISSSSGSNEEASSASKSSTAAAAAVAPPPRGGRRRMLLATHRAQLSLLSVYLDPANVRAVVERAFLAQGMQPDEGAVLRHLATAQTLVADLPLDCSVEEQTEYCCALRMSAWRREQQLFAPAGTPIEPVGTSADSARRRRR